MKSKQESIFAPLFDSFIAQRVEQLTTEAEKLPDYIKGRDSLQDLLAKASSVMGPEDLEAMVTAIALKETDARLILFLHFHHLQIL